MLASGIVVSVYAAHRRLQYGAPGAAAQHPGADGHGLLVMDEYNLKQGRFDVQDGAEGFVR